MEHHETPITEPNPATALGNDVRGLTGTCQNDQNTREEIELYLDHSNAITDVEKTFLNESGRFEEEEEFDAFGEWLKRKAIRWTIGRFTRRHPIGHIWSGTGGENNSMMPNRQRTGTTC